ncbi:MAG: endonuclease [Bacteroidales bacterium]
MKRLLLLSGVLFSLLSTLLYGQIPANYYTSAEGKKERELKTEIYKCIKSHQPLSYSQLWTAFRTTDVKPNGRVWDLYDNTTNYVFGDDQDKGTGNQDTYNREHSFPKSWFGSQSSSPMYTDLFHLYPCNTGANSKRGNLPFGKITGDVTWSNGYCKMGQMTTTGFSGTVFEPADEIKGDLARTYFYFATRYENEDFSKWITTPMTVKNKYPFYQSWVIDQLLDWHRNDPVSEREITRNEAVFKLQGNRNPFIDYQLLAEHIWGNKKEEAWYISTNAISQNTTSTLKIYSAESNLIIANASVGSAIFIYDITGKLLIQRIINDQKEIIPIKSGSYIIRIGSETFKMIH